MNNIDSLINYLSYSKELTINPFGLGLTSCNNKCDFCIISNRMSNKDVPLEYFKQTTNNTKKWLNKYIDLLPEDITITFFFVAGELFYLGKEYFDLYIKTAQELSEIVKKKYSKIKFNLQSNLLSFNQENIDNFINLSKEINKLTGNFSVTTSFDLQGRFSNEIILENWKKNLLYVQNELSKKVIVEMILTNPSLIRYNQENDNFTQTLDFILKNNDKFDVSFEEYILNEPKNSYLYPETTNLVEFYKKINSKFPDHPVLYSYKYLTENYHINNSKPRAECILIQFSDKPFDDDIVYTDEDLRIVSKNCLGGLLGNLIKYPKEEILKFNPQNNDGLYCIYNKKEVLDYFENKMGCAYCKYRPYCQPKCFIRSILKPYPERCQIKELFKLFSSI